MVIHNKLEPLRTSLGRDPRHKKFLKFKLEQTDKKFCEACDCPFLYEALKECYSLRYDELPDYSKLQFILKKALLQEDLVPGGKYLPQRQINYYSNLSDQEIPQEIEIPEEEAEVYVNESKVNPENFKANLD